MKVFSASQIRACDEATIRAGAMRSADLMERAASRCTEWITSRHSRDVLFVVVCGAGNNGGDGLAIARMLHQRNYGVKAFLLQYTDTMSEDCALNLDRLKVHDPALVTVIEPGTFISGLPAHIVIIDAIFGTGLSRPTSGWVADFIDSINQMPNKKIAIDMPSGLAPDYVPDEEKGVLKANETLTFQFYKRCFFHPESAPFTGGINLINIDLDRNFIAQASTQYYLTEKADIKAYYKPRKGFAHKGDFGKVLLIGGSYGKTGAIALSAMGALRAGAGTATTLAPECGYATLQANVPEAMCLTAGETHLTTLDAGNFTAIGIGPGMGTHVDTTKAFGDLLDNARAPIVADADALNM
ncbi:MAG: NAD(P)H-hydrate epimerase, partial [Chitinophagia bacterium]|nr:NAD(P)H-hydrate epimerase [Chitinophagia bacterium]